MHSIEIQTEAFDEFLRFVDEVIEQKFNIVLVNIKMLSEMNTKAKNVIKETFVYYDG